MSASSHVKPKMQPFTKELLLSENPLFSSSLFKKKVWSTIGGYKVRPVPHYEDWNFWCRAFKAGFKFTYAPIIIYEQTERSDSMLRQIHHNREELNRIATEELRYP